MQILVYAELDDIALRPASLSALNMAQQLADEVGGPPPKLLLVGHQLDGAAEAAAEYAPVIRLDREALAVVAADNFAEAIAQTVRQQSADLLVAASSAHSKDIVARAGGLLGGAMASDVVAHRIVDGQVHYDRPVYAGAAVATVRLHGTPAIVTVRGSAYPPAGPADGPGSVTSVEVEDAALTSRVRIVDVRSTDSGRPDVTEAKVVVSGGRAVKNSDDFERLIGGLADVLGGAAGSSRALVDAGIAPNELQVGQTGKVVAPQLYLAMGISGAVQHLAGMKNSRTVIAVNSDPDAPIFDEADYGYVGDIYEVAPQLIEGLQTAAMANGS